MHEAEGKRFYPIRLRPPDYGLSVVHFTKLKPGVQNRLHTNCHCEASPIVLSSVRP